MLEKKIAALKNMSKEELVKEYEKMVMYNTQHLEACLGKSGQFDTVLEPRVLLAIVASFYINRHAVSN